MTRLTQEVRLVPTSRGIRAPPCRWSSLSPQPRHAADLDARVDLLRDDPLGSGRESTDRSSYLRALAEIGRDDHQFLAVVRADDQTIAGTFQLTLIPGLARGGSTRLQIEAVRIAATARGTGLGRAMFDWAHAYGRHHGAVLAQLTSDTSRTGAHQFYAALGYRSSHIGYKREL